MFRERTVPYKWCIISAAAKPMMRCTDGVPKEKPRTGAGQLTESCPRRLEERRASKAIADWRPSRKLRISLYGHF
jgi:hypothetical protein